MRIEATKKMGFYPAHYMAVASLAKHLRPRAPDPTKKFDTVCALDPCAGKGEAIKQLTETIGIPQENVYTCELDVERGKACKELMPEGHHISPATFLGTQITGHSFGLAYVNPPFDFEAGGGRREEQAFVQAATPLLVVKGVLVLVCPLSALAGNGQFVDYIDACYEDVAVYKFPDGHDANGNLIRPYKEIAVIGRKRKEVLPRDMLEERGCLNKMDLKWRSSFQIENLPPLGGIQPVAWARGSQSCARETEIRVWELPHSWRPNTFVKNSLTDDELEEVLERSPLNKHFTESPPLIAAEPPLSLDKGHLGLTLASGVLDGVIHGPHGSHVVRGSSYKKQVKDHEATESTVNPETGAVTTKEVLRERMITVIRCSVDYPSPHIYTFSNDTKEEKEEHVDADDE